MCGARFAVGHCVAGEADLGHFLERCVAFGHGGGDNASRPPDFVNFENSPGASHRPEPRRNELAVATPPTIASRFSMSAAGAMYRPLPFPPGWIRFPVRFRFDRRVCRQSDSDSVSIVNLTSSRARALPNAGRAGGRGFCGLAATRYVSCSRATRSGRSTRHLGLPPVDVPGRGRKPRQWPSAPTDPRCMWRFGIGNGSTILGGAAREWLGFPPKWSVIRPARTKVHPPPTRRQHIQSPLNASNPPRPTSV